LYCTEVYSIKQDQDSGKTQAHPAIPQTRKYRNHTFTKKQTAMIAWLRFPISGSHRVTAK
jgi:hypothetical protein